MTERKKLIEVALPLDAINTESAREKSIRHGHPSTLHLWWARRPLATCRAVIFASLVDDPESEGCPQALLDAIDRLPAPDPLPIGWDALPVAQQRRERLFSFIARLVKWESTTDEHTINTARELIQAATGGNPPPLLDPFCGGGSIPLEAQRLGLEVYASDLNPVAVLITKALVEIPPKFAGQPPVNPDDRKKMGQDVAWKGAAGLAADVRWYGRWMRDRAWERIGHLYPKVRLTPGPSPSGMERGMKSAERRELCRELRQRQTPAEEFFWELVRDRRFDGLKFRRQHPLGRYIADFYCAEHKLAVELDGPVHADQAQRDKARDEALRTYGVRVVRIRNADLLADPEGALERVRREVAAPPAAASPSPSPMARGSGGEATVIAWLWARTVKCPNPACGAQMPLVRSFWLSTKKGRETWIEPIVDRNAKTVRFVVGSGRPLDERTIAQGSKTARGAKFFCLVCGHTADDQHIKDEGSARRMSTQLLAVVAEGSHSRSYISADEASSPIVSPPNDLRGLEVDIADDPRSISCKLYGLTTFADLFTPRQLVALTTFSDLVGEARALALEHARASPPDPLSIADGEGVWG